MSDPSSQFRVRPLGPLAWKSEGATPPSIHRIGPDRASSLLVVHPSIHPSIHRIGWMFTLCVNLQWRSSHLFVHPSIHPWDRTGSGIFAFYFVNLHWPSSRFCPSVHPSDRTKSGIFVCISTVESHSIHPSIHPSIHRIGLDRIGISTLCKLALAILHIFHFVCEFAFGSSVSR